MSKKTPTINKNLCIGCGLCESIYPEVFRLGEDFKSEVIGECEDEKKCQEAIDSCPVRAISWEEGVPKAPSTKSQSPNNNQITNSNN